MEKYSKYMKGLGICLDEDESAIDAYLEKTTLPFQHVFDPDNRRWDNQIVKYYGVRGMPQYWIVNHRGTVVGMTGDVEKID